MLFLFLKKHDPMTKEAAALANANGSQSQSMVEKNRLLKKQASVTPTAIQQVVGGAPSALIMDQT